MKRISRVLCVWMFLALVCFFCKENVQAAAIETECAAVVCSKTGFHPGGKNFASLKATVVVNYVDADLRIRVLNAKGKYVYQKTFKGIHEDQYVCIKWNGKASKGNTAGLKAGSYVPKGNYTMEASASYSEGGQKIYSTKTAKFVVNYGAPSGLAGRKSLNYVPMLTGYKEVDYLAEVMCNAAGVKSSMTQDQKVKKIYHWMTKYFKHTHYEQSKYKKYYNLSKLAPKVNTYRNNMYKKIKAGKSVFTYELPPYLSWNMERRIGVCTENASVFKALCNHVGVESNLCFGFYLNRNGTKAGHTWNSAVINGVTYYYDIDVEIQNYGKGQGDYYWYKKTLAQAKKTHQFAK